MSTDRNLSTIPEASPSACPSPVKDPLDHAGEPADAPPPVAMRSMPDSRYKGGAFQFDLPRALRRHRALAGTILLAGIGAAAACVATTWPVYDAECLVSFRPGLARSMAGAQNSLHDGNRPPPAGPQGSDPLGSDVLRAALQRLPGGNWKREGESEDDAIVRLGRTLSVEYSEENDQISIRASAFRASLSADIANAVAASLVEAAGKDLKSGDPQWVELLSEELDRIGKALGADRAELDQLNRMRGTDSQTGTAAAGSDKRINALFRELTKARAVHEEAAGRLTSLVVPDATSEAAIDSEAEDILGADRSLAGRKVSLNHRRAQLISEMASLAPKDAQYQQDAEELAQTGVSLETMRTDLRTRAVGNIGIRLGNDLEHTGADEAILSGRVARMTVSEGSMVARQQRAADLAVDIDRLRNRYILAEELYRNLSSGSQTPGAVFVSRPALPPLNPSVLHLLRDVVVLLLGSAVVAAASALAALNLDPRVYVARDVERALGFSPMAQLPDFQQVSADVGEEYLGLLAGAIEYVYQQTGLKTYLITGVAPGAGASAIASRVTTMLEGTGRPTILIDAAAKPTPPREAILKRIAGQEDEPTIVLADAAPLVTSGETQYLARFVDSAIVVIQSGLTTRDQLLEVADALQRLDVAAVGFVLNRVSISEADPLFRQSIRATEQRLAHRNRLRAHDLPRTSAQHPRASAQEPPVLTEPDTVNKPDNNPTPDHSPRSGAMDPTADSQATGTATIAGAEAAAPVRVARGRGEPAKSPRAPRSSGAPRAGTAAPSGRAGNEVAGTTAPARVAPSPEPFPELVPAIPVAAPKASRMAERVPPSPPLPSRQPATPGSVAGDLSSNEDDEDVVPSRLSGLRNLLVTLGRRSLGGDGDAPEESDADIEPRFERAKVRHAYPEMTVPEADAPHHGGPAALTAQPEFLRPKPAAQPDEEEAEKEKEVKLRPTPQRRDTPEGEEVQTLPSWRGQYRKKRYPPL